MVHARLLRLLARAWRDCLQKMREGSICWLHQERLEPRQGALKATTWAIKNITSKRNHHFGIQMDDAEWCVYSF